MGFNDLFHQLSNKEDTPCIGISFVFILFQIQVTTAYDFQASQSAQWKVRTGCNSKNMLAQQTTPGAIQKEKVTAAMSMTSDKSLENPREVLECDGQKENTRIQAFSKSSTTIIYSHFINGITQALTKKSHK